MFYCCCRYKVEVDSVRFSKVADSEHAIEASLSLDNADTVVGMRVYVQCDSALCRAQQGLGSCFQRTPLSVKPRLIRQAHQLVKKAN